MKNSHLKIKFFQKNLRAAETAPKSEKSGYIIVLNCGRSVFPLPGSVQAADKQYTVLHCLSCGRQQCKQAACKQKIKPAIGSGNGITRPQAAGDSKSILHRHIAQHPNVKIPHLTRCSCLYLRISKTPDRMIRNNDHHATPEQIGKNISKGAVKRTKRNADQRSYQRFPCQKVSFLCRGKGVLQKIKENHAGYPAEL